MLQPPIHDDFDPRDRPQPDPAPDWLTKRRRLDRWLSWLRVCAVCSSAFPPIDYLCEACWRDLDRIRNRGPWLAQPGYPFPVYSLLTWTRENDAIVRPLIYGLKGGYQLQAYEKLSQLLSHERNLKPNQLKPFFLHPPARTERADHSEVLASLFAESWKTDICKLETDDSERSQKQLTRSERATRRFEEVIGRARYEDPAAPRIFVDDVITTGATAIAAYLALGRPAAFEVWTLVCRPKLATFDTL